MSIKTRNAKKQVKDSIREVAKHLMEYDFRNVYIKNNWSIDEITNVMVKTFCSSIQNNEWISVEDRLPEPFLNVLLILKGGEQTDSFVGFHDGKKFHDYEDNRTNSDSISHWQPLPEPPKK